jgi:hypothetical protein
VGAAPGAGGVPVDAALDATGALVAVLVVSRLREVAGPSRRPGMTVGPALWPEVPPGLDPSRTTRYPQAGLPTVGGVA